MKILIIGGTKFFGRHLITAALDRGHEVTIFHRGKTRAENPANIEEILGDRNFDLDKLSGRKWDTLIDTCGYLPQLVRASAASLIDAVERYLFISSISAYADFRLTDYDETAALAQLTAEQYERFVAIDPKEDVNGAILGDMYGALKTLCEKEVSAVFDQRALIIRPGLIVGEFDFTDRFTYWVMRIAKGGDVLAPGQPDRFVQIIDAKDLAEWIIRMIEEKETGIYNAVGKPFETTFGAILGEIKAQTESDANFVWGNDEFLENEGVAAWTEMPVYLPEKDEFAGFESANIDRALAKGLVFRPLAETIRDTFEWRRKQEFELRAGISAEREKELLDKWNDL